MSERDYQAAKNLWEFKNPGRSYRHESELVWTEPNHREETTDD